MTTLVLTCPTCGDTARVRPSGTPGQPLYCWDCACRSGQWVPAQPYRPTKSKNTQKVRMNACHHQHPKRPRRSA